MEEFLQECKSIIESEVSVASNVNASASNNVSASASNDLDTKGGTLLIMGCDDWESSETGLEVPHQITLPSPVLKSFSGCTANHFFVLLASGKLLACGRNKNGQLGLGK